MGIWKAGPDDKTAAQVALEQANALPPEQQAEHERPADWTPEQETPIRLATQRMKMWEQICGLTIKPIVMDNPLNAGGPLDVPKIECVAAFIDGKFSRHYMTGDDACFHLLAHLAGKPYEPQEVGARVHAPYGLTEDGYPLLRCVKTDTRRTRWVVEYTRVVMHDERAPLVNYASPILLEFLPFAKEVIAHWQWLDTEVRAQRLMRTDYKRNCGNFGEFRFVAKRAVHNGCGVEQNWDRGLLQDNREAAIAQQIERERTAYYQEAALYYGEEAGKPRG